MDDAVLLLATILADMRFLIFAVSDGVQTTGQPHGVLVAIAVLS